MTIPCFIGSSVPCAENYGALSVHEHAQVAHHSEAAILKPAAVLD
jgi:hypothetical protein